jgi:hypothetical protein
MQTTTFMNPGDWPRPPQNAPSASLPRYLKNEESRDHLAGKKLSAAVLQVELERLCVVWQKLQHTRQRDAVYNFLEAAYGLVSKFNRTGQGARLLRKLHRLDRKLKRITEPFSAVIHHATDHSVDSRTRSKWSRIMKRAEREKKRTELLEDFVRRLGGINECATRRCRPG